MASSDPSREAIPDLWLRWLWVPIVVPGIILGLLAWRAVSNEQGLLRGQVAEGRLRLASQVAGILQGAGREFQHQSTRDLVSWALEVREAPDLPLPEAFDAAAVFLDGRQVVPSSLAEVVADAARLRLGLAMSMAEVSRSGSQEALGIAERFLMEALHIPVSALGGDLEVGLSQLEVAIEPHLSMEPHWRPVFEDLFEGVRHRISDLEICRLHASTISQLAESGRTGMRNADGYSWIVLAPPDLPEGQVVVAAYSDRILRERLAGDLPGIGADSGSMRLGLLSSVGKVFLPSDSGFSDDPEVVVGVPGRFPDWSVAVWSEGTEGQDAARFRAAFLAALLGLSLGILVGAAWLATRSLASQRQLLAMKTDFVSNVTHELKTPLTGIFLYAELLAGGKAEGRSKEFGSVVLREARRLEGMLDGILSFARQEAGHAASRRDRLPLAELIRECAASFKPIALQRGIDLVLDLEEVVVPGDPALLRSIAGNLMDNAIKYGRDGGFVHISLVPEGKEAVLRVRDDGRGIPKSQQTKVFDRFFRGGGELTRNVPGTGLGLAIVKRSVEIHGGQIILHSDEGAGTTMEIRLPRSEETRA
ncbi:MAG: HAMP domain-containing histidine kinase [Fibrobacteria bacterium]|nr:HAMP domain-containing histidine kinase [Fibrobacteria bacterium]